MFNDRDLGILGAGALLAVFCLVLPLSFAGKVALGLAVLSGSIVLALLRLGPDRIPVEEWLKRRIRFRLQARRYTYQQPGYAQRPRHPWWRRPQRDAQQPDPPHRQPIPVFSSSPQTIGVRPVDLALNEVGVYPLVTVFLAVVGIYLLVWLSQGGAGEIALLLGGFVP